MGDEFVAKRKHFPTFQHPILFLSLYWETLTLSTHTHIERERESENLEIQLRDTGGKRNVVLRRYSFSLSLSRM